MQRGITATGDIYRIARFQLGFSMGQAVALFFTFTGVHARKDTNTGPFPCADAHPDIAARAFIAATQAFTVFSAVQRNIIFGLQTEVFACLQFAALYANIPGPVVPGGGDGQIISGSNVTAAGGSLLKAAF
ncbi:Uncharacterised protein [Yersinia aldovae]|uniref:Uncharacterized protein n=1 Tax=Yersinia aldovae TaxID=29483 RepID=A0ABP1YVJ1_YERAL|nr:Uncharacterised protein [Yersinia aldovae]